MNYFRISSIAATLGSIHLYLFYTEKKQEIKKNNICTKKYDKITGIKLHQKCKSILEKCPNVFSLKAAEGFAQNGYNGFENDEYGQNGYNGFENDEYGQNGYNDHDEGDYEVGNQYPNPDLNPVVLMTQLMNNPTISEELREKVVHMGVLRDQLKCLQASGKRVSEHANELTRNVCNTDHTKTDISLINIEILTLNIMVDNACLIVHELSLDEVLQEYDPETVNTYLTMDQNIRLKIDEIKQLIFDLNNKLMELENENVDR